MRCFYELLQIPQNASKKEIIKVNITVNEAYRIKALIHHPDKNPERIDEATEYFASLQEAFQTLSNDHDKMFYDRHRAEILRGPIDLSKHGQTDEFMSTEQVFTYFSYTHKTKTEFYDFYRELFVKIDLEERKAMEKDPFCKATEQEEFYTFGDDSTNWNDLLLFYKRFQAFTTVKSFYWFDIYRPMDFQDRKLRRNAEKENKKIREKHRKEFNESVQQLAAYVKRRDPRYKAVKEEEKARLEAGKLQIVENEKLKRQEWIKLGESFVEPDWSRMDDQDLECVICDVKFNDLVDCLLHNESTVHAEAIQKIKGEFSTVVTVEVDADVIRCDICEKDFSTTSQLSQHENSKKHKSQLKLLRKK
jgi:DnaJ homolog subfamily A member 5